MEANIESEEVYCLGDRLDAAAFFDNLRRLLPKDNWVIGIGCYGPDREVRAWLNDQPKAVIAPEFDFHQQFETYRADYPSGGAFYLPANSAILSRIARFASQFSQTPERMCDHVIGIGDEGALFSFHDAFQGGNLLISPAVPKDAVEVFAAALGAKCERISNPQIG